MKQIKFNNPTVYHRQMLGAIGFFILEVINLSTLQYRPLLNSDDFGFFEGGFIYG